MVDDELCGDLEPTVDGDPNIIVQEPCTVPCPGKRTVTQTGPSVVGCHWLTSSLFLGECYLTDWTIWSPCQLSCVSGDDLGFGSVQVRSRAVVAQDPENLLQCPEQELEARPCTGQIGRLQMVLQSVATVIMFRV